MTSYIEYRSVSSLGEVLLKNLHKFPHNADLIVGIPRSGMLPATLLSLYLNKPLTDLDSFIKGHIYGAGNRGKTINLTQSDLIIVVDDTISSGRAMKAARLKLSQAIQGIKIIYSAVYAASEGKSCVDIYCELINGPRIFQWNLFHEINLMAKSCMDIDGVLCPNPTVDDDGEKYLDYIINAKPLIIPTVEINTLVTCRLEKYRGATEDWLFRNGVKYRNLIMLDLPSRDARLKWGRHGEYKGGVYKQTNCILFIESSKEEAIKICNESGKQVFCVETLEMFYGRHKYISKVSTKTQSYFRRQVKKLIPYRFQPLIKKIMK